jgi:hypothetical protein
VSNQQDITELVIRAKAITQEAFDKAVADLEKLDRKSKEAGKSAGGLGKAFGDIKPSLMSLAGAVGIGFSAGAVVSFGKHVFDTASGIHDMAEKLGISTDAVQGFKFAADQSGSSLDAVGTAINKMNANLAEGSKSTVSALKAAGLNFQAIRSMKPEDAFLAIADGIQRIPDPMVQARVALDLFGKSSSELLPAIKEGFRDAANGADKMSKDTVDSLEAAQDAWDQLGNKVTIVSGTIIAHAMNITKTVTSSWKSAVMFLDNAIQGGVGFAAAAADVAGQAAAAVAKPAEAASKVPAIIHRTQEEIAAAEEAAKKAATAYEKYADLLREIAQAGVPLTAFQKEQVRMLEGLGVGAGKIADVLRVTDAQVSKFTDALREEAKAVAEIGKQIGNIPRNVPLHLQSENLSGFAPQIDVAAVTASSEGLRQVHEATFNEIESRMRGMGVLTQDVLRRNAQVAREQYESMRQSGLFTAQELEDAFARMVAANDAATSGWAAHFHSALESLPDLIVSAFTGGGGLSGALTAWGSKIGSDFGKQLFGPKGLLAGIGSLIPGIGPAIGSLLGPALGKVVDLFKGMFDRNQGRDVVSAFAGDHGGFDALHKELLELGAAGEQMWIQLTQGVGRNDANAARAAVDAVTKALEDHKQKVEEDAAAVETAAKQTTAAQQAALDSAKAKVAELDGQIKQMQDSVANEAPEEEMGIVERTTREKIAAMQEERDKAADVLNDLTAQMASSLADVADAINKLPEEIAIKLRVELEGGAGGREPLPQHDQGAYIRETHVAQVHAGEMVGDQTFFGAAIARGLAAAGRSGGGAITIRVPVNIDGRQVALANAKYQREVLSPFGVR